MKNAVVIVVIVVSLVLIFAAYWLLSPLVIDTVVDEEITIDISRFSNTDEDVSETQKNNKEKNTVEIRQGSFIDADSTHFASGDVYVSGQDISFVNLDSTNVPDGRVYLSNNIDATDFVDIGSLKGNKGNQNYKVAEDINTQDYKYVLIWCRAFSVLVGSAEIL